MVINFNFKKYILITIGCFLLAIGINIFYFPSSLVTGGFTGIGIIAIDVFKKYFNISLTLWQINIVLNIPTFIIAYFVLGIKFIARSIFATIMLIFALFVMEHFSIDGLDLFLSAVFGGLFSGIGLGIVFRNLATTGGTDLVSAIIQKKFLRHQNISKILLCIDIVIISLGMFTFGMETAMYSIIAIVICTKVIDIVLEGLGFAKAVLIISKEFEQISSIINKELDRGTTGLYSKGMFHNEDKMTLLTVVSKKELIRLKEMVKTIDDRAFIIVADVREVLGEGFSE